MWVLDDRIMCLDAPNLVFTGSDSQSIWHVHVLYRIDLVLFYVLIHLDLSSRLLSVLQTPFAMDSDHHLANGIIKSPHSSGVTVVDAKARMKNTTPTSTYSDDITLKDVSAWTPDRRLDIITVGAGFSGLIFAHKLQHQFPEMQGMVNHKIFEARDDIGGTWLVNRYPGVQCDVPAHIYVLSLA